MLVRPKIKRNSLNKAEWRKRIHAANPKKVGKRHAPIILVLIMRGL